MEQYINLIFSDFSPLALIISKAKFFLKNPFLSDIENKSMFIFSNRQIYYLWEKKINYKIVWLQKFELIVLGESFKEDNAHKKQQECKLSYPFQFIWRREKSFIVKLVSSFFFLFIQIKVILFFFWKRVENCLSQLNLWIIFSLFFFIILFPNF